jgi:NADPH2:quinone reductase
MRAIVISRPGGPDVLEPRDVRTPEPGSHQIRVRVHGASLNQADLMQRRGHYPAPPGVPADIPGLDYAGTVDSLGDDSRRQHPGDRVMGLVAGGGYAEYVVVHEDEAIPVPASLTLEEAAAVPEVFFTAHDALRQLAVVAGEWLVVHGIGSGVGTAALQLARAAGVRVIGTARSRDKLERAAALGLDHGIDSTEQDWVEEVQKITGGGAQAIMDLVGGAFFSGDVRASAKFGRILAVGLVAGAKAELDFRVVLNKRLSIRGTVLRSRSLEEKIAVARAFEDTGSPLLASGAVRPVIDAVRPFAEVRAAHEQLESGTVFGKIVLVWERDS